MVQYRLHSASTNICLVKDGTNINQKEMGGLSFLSFKEMKPTSFGKFGD